MRIGSIAELKSASGAASASAATQPQTYVILDQTTLAWASAEPIRKLADVPSCWVAHAELVPTVQGVGWRLQNSLDGWLGQLHLTPEPRALKKWRAQSVPLRAVVFKVPQGVCG